MEVKLAKSFGSARFSVKVRHTWNNPTKTFGYELLSPLSEFSTVRRLDITNWGAGSLRITFAKGYRIVTEKALLRSSLYARANWRKIRYIDGARASNGFLPHPWKAMNRYLSATPRKNLLK
ncbi:hypothetical protein [Ovoidimarina sediminis]|uniref:hypothetical protein n=1 Tax=Ovoidimarina sediminis TaxID=3079856 RepID=UPI00290F765C|nr:hypothetical protein [Rhodophyticola sp. MJ-SS7]MDU8944956.1 hypothetical protein [Rhodophyticola sp. MJ-SS7]